MLAINRPAQCTAASSRTSKQSISQRVYSTPQMTIGLPSAVCRSLPTVIMSAAVLSLQQLCLCSRAQDRSCKTAVSSSVASAPSCAAVFSLIAPVFARSCTVTCHNPCVPMPAQTVSNSAYGLFGCGPAMQSGSTLSSKTQVQSPTACCKPSHTIALRVCNEVLRSESTCRVYSQGLHLGPTLKQAKLHQPSICCRQITDEFRKSYALLWQSLIFADAEGIKQHSQAMNAGDMYPLFAGMLTNRPWDEVCSHAINPFWSPAVIRNRCDKTLLCHQQPSGFSVCFD